MTQKHYHYTRIKLFDKLKYIGIGAAVGMALSYHSAIDPLEYIKEKVESNRQSIESVVGRIMEYSGK